MKIGLPNQVLAKTVVGWGGNPPVKCSQLLKFFLMDSWEASCGAASRPCESLWPQLNVLDWTDFSSGSHVKTRPCEYIISVTSKEWKQSRWFLSYCLFWFDFGTVSVEGLLLSNLLFNGKFVLFFTQKRLLDPGCLLSWLYPSPFVLLSQLPPYCYFQKGQGTSVILLSASLTQKST